MEGGSTRSPKESTGQGAGVKGLGFFLTGSHRLGGCWSGSKLLTTGKAPAERRARGQVTAPPALEASAVITASTPKGNRNHRIQSTEALF